MSDDTTRAAFGFYQPLDWKATTLIGLVIVWTYLYEAMGLAPATAAVLVLLGVVAAVWYTVRRRWWGE